MSGTEQYQRYSFDMAGHWSLKNKAGVFSAYVTALIGYFPGTLGNASAFLADSAAATCYVLRTLGKADNSLANFAAVTRYVLTTCMKQCLLSELCSRDGRREGAFFSGP